MLVLGDSMADWLADGLEDALGDTPDLAVVRKNRAAAASSATTRRNEREDWAQVIPKPSARTKPKFVVMMVGLNDRVAIRDRVAQPAQPAGAAAKTPVPPTAAPAAGQPAAAPETSGQEPRRSQLRSGRATFRRFRRR